MGSPTGRTALEESDDRHCWLLRARRERPRGGSTAEECDELAAFHLITKALPMPVSTARPPWLRDTARSHKRPIFLEALNST